MELPTGSIERSQDAKNENALAWGREPGAKASTKTVADAASFGKISRPFFVQPAIDQVAGGWWLLLRDTRATSTMQRP